MNDLRDDTLPNTWFQLVKVCRVIELHAEAVRKTGECATILNDDLLQGAVSNALTAAMYIAEDGSPDIICVAAHLLYYIARDHAFEQGNKRTGWLTCEEQLRIAGLRIDATTDEAERLVLGVVRGELDTRAVVEWIAQHLAAYELSVRAD